MANLSITTTDVHPVVLLEQMTLPAAEAVDAGELAAVDGNGKAALVSAGEAAGRWGLVLTTAAANVPTTLVLRGLVSLGDALAALAYGDRLWMSATEGKIATTDISKNEVQTATITGSPTGGTFTLTFGGQTTSAIAYNATAAAVQTALEALSTIGTANVVVTGSAGGPYTITFVNDLGKLPQAALTATASLTGGTTPGVTIAESIAGLYSRVIGVVEAVPADTTPVKALRLG